MANISDRIKDLSIFRSFFAPGNACMAINNRSQLVIASGNAVKTCLVSGKHNYYKLLQRSNDTFDVVDLSFNESGNLVALIGSRSVTICDTKSLPCYDSDSTVWETFNFQIGPFDSDLKSFLWHPASRLESEFVVLTNTEILLYDAVISFSNPMLILKLLDYQELAGKTVNSISFGSKDNFAGSILLYLTTTQGAVYAIYPFVYKGSKISAKKNLVILFIRETVEALEEVQSIFPPVALLDSPHVLALHQQHSFAQELEVQVNRPSNSALKGDDIITLSHSGETFGHVLQGPLANIGSTPIVVKVGSNDDVAILASVHSENSKAVFTYLAQLQPLIMGWKNPQHVLEPPVEPAKPSLKKHEEKYSKPVKGFGYVVDSDSESEDEDVEYIKSSALFKEDSEIFTLKNDLVKYFSDNFNKISVLAVNGTSFSCGIGKGHLQNVDGDKLIFAKDGQLFFIDLLQSIDLIFSDDGDFEPDYKVALVSPHAKGFAYFKDSLERLRQYVIVFAPGSPVEVVPLEAPTKKSSDMVHDSFPQYDLDKTFVPGFLTGELSTIMKSISTKPLPRVTEFSPEDTKSMSQVFDVADVVAERTSEFMKFMLTLQLKVRTQLDVLRIQVEELNKINKKSESTADSEMHDAKIEELTLRQTKLLKKAQKIKDSISERFEGIKLSFALPLSAAEKNWFKEINHLNKLINVGDNDEKSLVEQIKGLRLEVLDISTNLEKRTTQHNGVDITIEQLSLSNELTRMKHFLLTESKLIASVKELANVCNRKLGETGSLSAELFVKKS